MTTKTKPAGFSWVAWAVRLRALRRDLNIPKPTAAAAFNGVEPGTTAVLLADAVAGSAERFLEVCELFQKEEEQDAIEFED